MLLAQHAAETRLVREADMGANGRWLVEQVAPDLVTMLHEASDATDLSRLVGLVIQGVAQVARDCYEGLAPQLAGE